MSLAMKAKQSSDGQVSQLLATGSVNQHKVNEYFEKAWKELVLPQFRNDKEAMNKLKMLFVYSRCTYRFRAGCLTLKKNFDGNIFRNYGWIISNRRMHGV